MPQLPYIFEGIQLFFGDTMSQDNPDFQPKAFPLKKNAAHATAIHRNVLPRNH
jgi:hypothetical protein